MTHVVDDLIEDALRELADEQAQEALWRAVNGPDVSSLIECTSRLWDDSGLSTAMEQPGDVYNPGIDDRLGHLRRVLHRIDATQPVESVLANPYLSEVRELAQGLLEDIRRFGHDDATTS